MMNSNTRNTYTALKDQAETPEIDPCEIACEAMPGYICGDLESVDRQWVDHHTESCDYCQHELHQFQGSSALIDLVSAQVGELNPPTLSWQIAQPVAKYGRVDTMLGPLLIAVSEQGVCELGFARSGEDEYLDELRMRGFTPVEDLEAVQPVVERLERYFSGQATSFDLPVDLEGVTPFTQSVLKATSEIPFGSLLTYKDIAVKIGKPNATRAVGNALGRNPIPVIVPCHRVIRSDQTLGGYTGGLDIKETLLHLEGATL